MTVQGLVDVTYAKRNLKPTWQSDYGYMPQGVEECEPQFFRPFTEFTRL